MSEPKQCPDCGSKNIYFDGIIWNCPECFKEWSLTDAVQPEDDEGVVKDAFGQPLVNGDSVTVIKDLKVKGASSPVKVGTKVKNIRLVDGPDGHNISCRIEGFGAMNLKSEFVKKA